MILANIEAAIEAKRKERNHVFDELDKIDNMIEKLKHQKSILLDHDNMIEKLKHQKSILLDHDTDLYYEIEELKEQLNNEL